MDEYEVILVNGLDDDIDEYPLSHGSGIWDGGSGEDWHQEYEAFCIEQNLAYLGFNSLEEWVEANPQDNREVNNDE